MADRAFFATPGEVDVVKADGRYEVCADGRPMKTPGGRSIASTSLRLLEQVVRERAASPSPEGLDALALFTHELDGIAPAREQVLNRLAGAIEQDPLARRKFGLARQEEASALISGADSHPLLFLYGSLVLALQGAALQLMEYSQGRAEDAFASLDGLSRALSGPLAEQCDAGLCVIDLLGQRHQSGVLLPFLLVLDQLTPSEYANAALCLGHGRCKRDPGEVFQAIRADASCALDYLACSPAASRRGPSLAELVARGESYDLEFKSTLRMNLHTGKKDPAIVHSCLKTVAAFLNSSGGTLVVGVADDGSAVGIEEDGFENRDRFELHFWQQVEAGLGTTAPSCVSVRFESLGGRTAFVVHVAPAPEPIFANQKGFGEEFFVRVGPSTRKLSIRDALSYIEQRFGREA